MIGQTVPPQISRTSCTQQGPHPMPFLYIQPLHSLFRESSEDASARLLGGKGCSHLTH